MKRDYNKFIYVEFDLETAKKAGVRITLNITDRCYDITCPDGSKGQSASNNCFNVGQFEDTTNKVIKDWFWKNISCKTVYDEPR